ncbi:MAG: class D sortase [Acidobacteriota bacterium]
MTTIASPKVRTIEQLLWGIGLAATTYCVSYIGYGAIQQAVGEWELAALSPSSGIHSEAAPKLSPGAVLGRVRIPRLEISSVVFEGTGESQLAKGVGHWTGSPVADESGNVVLAAHRDTFFRGLGEIENGDKILLSTRWGDATYEVTETRIVWPKRSGRGPEDRVAQPHPDYVLPILNSSAMRHSDSLSAHTKSRPNKMGGA